MNRDPLPALGERAVEAGRGVLIRLRFRAKIRGVLLAQPQIFCSQRIEGRNLGVVCLAEANLRYGTGQAHGCQFAPSVANNCVFFRLACLR